MLSGYHVWSDQVLRWWFSNYICKCWRMPWFVKKMVILEQHCLLSCFYHGGSASAIALKWWIFFGLMTSGIGKKIWRIWSPPTSTTQSFGYPTILKRRHQYSTPFSPKNPIPFCEFSRRYLWWLFLQGSTCINQWGNCRWYTVSCARWLAFGFFGWSVWVFFSGLKLKNSLFLGGKALDNFNAFPERTSLFMSCCWQMVVRFTPWNNMARRMVSWTLIFSCR